MTAETFNEKVNEKKSIKIKNRHKSTYKLKMPKESNILKKHLK